MVAADVLTLPKVCDHGPALPNGGARGGSMTKWVFDGRRYLPVASEDQTTPKNYKLALKSVSPDVTPLFPPQTRFLWRVNVSRAL